MRQIRTDEYPPYSLAFGNPLADDVEQFACEDRRSAYPLLMPENADLPIGFLFAAFARARKVFA